MKLAVAVLIGLLSIGNLAVADDYELTRKSLKGIKGVAVLVEDLNPEVQAGLSCIVIQRDAELKLRLAGIPVLTDPISSEAVLYIKASVDTRRTPWAYAADVELLQAAILKRDSSISLPRIPTWSVSGRGGYAIPGDLAILRDNLKDSVDMFINAYLSVNPK
jgi:hypothetical protein